MHHFAWVVMGLPGCHTTADEEPGGALFESSRAVKFLVPPGAVWGMSAGAPVMVHVLEKGKDAREAVVFEMGDSEWSRNLMHAVLAVDTLDALVRFLLAPCWFLCHLVG